MPALAILHDLSIVELRLARREPDRRASMQLLAIAIALKGLSRGEAARRAVLALLPPQRLDEPQQHGPAEALVHVQGACCARGRKQISVAKRLLPTPISHRSSAEVALGRARGTSPCKALSSGAGSADAAGGPV
jgi:hypothetical protein